MKLEDRNIEEIDNEDEYEMVPLEPMMYGCGQMNMMPNMVMASGCMQDTNLNMRMSSCMGMNQNTGINQWMGVSQFNYGMPMNEFNQFGIMYEDASMNDYEEEN